MDDFSPHWHLYPHKISTVVVRNKSVSVLQEEKKTPKNLLKQSLQGGFARYCLTPRLFAFSLPFCVCRVLF